ncbi:MAG: histidine--tRNA ligase [Paludibacteraceae bacterium]|nr:histidine--tRNA ligase [Paludibacteraceae bacterium]
MIAKPSIPKGTRDFLPEETAKRNYIFDTIKSVYSLHGFQQIETPAMENLSTLMGKYGEEGDKLLFKILNSGDYMSALTDDELLTKNSVKLTSKLSEKGLRYDLTVPFARFVVQYRDQIKFPFRRFQIQPVWRADRPQKGRYREFYQCDADIVGSDSLLNELELVQIIDEVFARFGMRVAVKLNNRKILAGIAEIIGENDKIVDITVAIDKLDKIGIDNVNAELREKGLSDTAVAKLQPILAMSGANKDKINELAQILKDSEIGMKGVNEMQTLFSLIENAGIQCQVDADLTLARGLNYYTGTIIEVKALDFEIGSITGGGRYDNLTGVFGVDGLSGVGISFGADRIYDVLNGLNLYPESITCQTKVIFLNLGEKEVAFALPVVKSLRQAGVAVELYADAAKFKKQMGYANDRKIPYVAIIGESELQSGVIALKDMTTGEQTNLTAEELIAKLQ